MEANLCATAKCRPAKTAVEGLSARRAADDAARPTFRATVVEDRSIPFLAMDREEMKTEPGTNEQTFQSIRMTLTLGVVCVFQDMDDFGKFAKFQGIVQRRIFCSARGERRRWEEMFSSRRQTSGPQSGGNSKICGNVPILVESYRTYVGKTMFIQSSIKRTSYVRAYSEQSLAIPLRYRYR